MKMTTLQWNIGGGHARASQSDPTDFLSYVHANENLEMIANVILEAKPDVVTLQETHADGSRVQAEVLAKMVGLNYWVNDVNDDSHLEKGQKLGQAILSRFPIIERTFHFLLNPKLEMTAPMGEQWQSHDKGVTTVVIDVHGVFVELKTIHTFPYKKFGEDPLTQTEPVRSSRESIDRLLQSNAEHLLIQGDFNYDGKSLRPFLPRLFEVGVEEVIQDEPTTPKGRRYDHILFRGMDMVSSSVVQDVLTDHYPIVSVLKIKE